MIKLVIQRSPRHDKEISEERLHLRLHFGNATGGVEIVLNISNVSKGVYEEEN